MLVHGTTAKPSNACTCASRGFWPAAFLLSGLFAVTLYGVKNRQNNNPKNMADSRPKALSPLLPRWNLWFPMHVAFCWKARDRSGEVVKLRS
jgi:hypothetical protein